MRSKVYMFFFISLATIQLFQGTAYGQEIPVSDNLESTPNQNTFIGRFELSPEAKMNASTLPATSTYKSTLSAINKQRMSWAKKYNAAATPENKAQVLAKAGQALEDAVTDQILPYWYTTPFDRKGMSEKPREGKIGCSYFVSTMLRDAGVKMNRVKLAQQSAKGIIQSLCDSTKVKRCTDSYQAEIMVKNQGKGLYVIAFNYHIGYLYNDGASVYLVHASSLPPRQVVKLPIQGWESSQSFAYSPYYDIGKVGENETLVKRWLKNQAISIVIDGGSY